MSVKACAQALATAYAAQLPAGQRAPVAGTFGGYLTRGGISFKPALYDALERVGVLEKQEKAASIDATQLNAAAEALIAQRQQAGGGWQPLNVKACAQALAAAYAAQLPAGQGAPVAGTFVAYLTRGGLSFKPALYDALERAGVLEKQGKKKHSISVEDE